MKFKKLTIDSKIIDALNKVGEMFVNDYRDRMRQNLEDQLFNAPIQGKHPLSLLTLYGWTGIWNSLSTIQKMKVFRFVYKVENAEVVKLVIKFNK